MILWPPERLSMYAETSQLVSSNRIASFQFQSCIASLYYYTFNFLCFLFLLKEKNTNMTYTCRKCKRVFDCNKHRKSHQRHAHRTRKYLCECGKGFACTRDLDRHRATHRDNPRIPIRSEQSTLVTIQHPICYNTEIGTCMYMS